MYTQSLTADPSLQATTWALFRLFSGRGAWDNLLRLLDAELRFAPLPTAADRADVLVEKGRVLEDRLGREAEARAAYRSALELDRTHPAALLALLLAALRAGVQGEVEEALRGLVQVTDEPNLRALFAVELSRLERGSLAEGGDPARVRRAAETLFQLPAGPGGRGADLRGAGSAVAGGRRSRAARPGAGPAGLAAGPGSRPPGGPTVPCWWRCIGRRPACWPDGGPGTRRWPCSSAGCGRRPVTPCWWPTCWTWPKRPGAPMPSPTLLEQSGLEPGSYRHDEALLRRAESASRAGALGEAAGSLDQLAPDSALAPLVDPGSHPDPGPTGRRGGAVPAVRVGGRAAGGVGYRGGRRTWRPHGHAAARPNLAGGARGGPPAVPGRGHSPGNTWTMPAGAEALLTRALELSPGYPPARETLRAALVRAAQLAGAGRPLRTRGAADPGPDGGARPRRSRC